MGSCNPACGEKKCSIDIHDKWLKPLQSFSSVSFC